MNTNRLAAGFGLVALLTAGSGSVPVAYADPGDQASAEQAVHVAYDLVQARCTPSKAPAFQSISWQQFSPATFGQGTIHDAEPSLGGDFKAYYNRPGGPQIPRGVIKHGDWYVQLEFC
jgi:hypothetical protein